MTNYSRALIKAWVNEHAYNGEYKDILITMTQKWNCYSGV